MARADWKKRIGLAGGTFAAALTMSAWVPAQQKPEDLTKSSIEDLLNIELTTISKRNRRARGICCATST